MYLMCFADNMGLMLGGTPAGTHLLPVTNVYMQGSCCRRGGELRAVYQGMQTEVEVTGLQSGLTYRFRVTAFNQVPPQTCAARLATGWPQDTLVLATIATAP